MKFKRIIATITLATMAATFPFATGLAEDLAPAEETAFEQAEFTGEAEFTGTAWEAEFTEDDTVAPPTETFEAEENFEAEETFAAEEDEPEAIVEMEEVVEEIAEPEAAEAEDAEAMEEAVEFDENAGQPEDAEEAEEAEEAGEAAEPEVAESMDLMAAFDEADMPEVAEEAPEVDRTAMMENLINEAMDARQDEGINAALDNTFATLAQNAMELANPETGVIEVSGDEIVAMTANAAEARFGITGQQLEGAIGVAALRAETNGGYVSALGGDAQLMSMAATEGRDEEAQHEVMNETRDLMGMGIDTLSISHPAFKAISPAMKAAMNLLFDERTAIDIMIDIQLQLDEIDQKLDVIEQDLMDHMLNVVSMESLGSNYDTINDAMTLLREKVKNIWNPALDKTREQRISETAALYDSPVVTNLEQAITAATHSFQGDTNISINRISIFEAAYRTACLKVMFSREAIDATGPYIYRLLATYMAGYATLDTVYDAYEEVYGAASLSETRNNMNMRLAGVDGSGNKTGKSMFDLCTDYFNRDKYTFVGKSNSTAIRCSKELLYVCDFAENFTKGGMLFHDSRKAPDFMRKFPLSARQVEDLAEYCRGKKISLFKYLFNEIKFEPKVMTKVWSKKDGWHLGIMDTQEVKSMIGNSFGFNWVSFPGLPMEWILNDKGLKNMYLAVGPQDSFEHCDDDHDDMIRCKAIKAAGLPGKPENLVLYSKWIRSSDRPQGHTKNVFMIFLQPA